MRSAIVLVIFLAASALSVSASGDQFQRVGDSAVIDHVVHVSSFIANISINSTNTTGDAELTPGRLGAGAVLVTLGAILCAGGGIGGGGIYVPTFILILGLTPHQAVPLSKIAIFGVSIGSIIFLSRARHPEVDRPLIDFRVATLFEPMTLLGSIIGVMLNVVTPAYLITMFLVLLLGVAAFRTFRKGIRLYRKENDEKSLRSTQLTEVLSSADSNFSSADFDEPSSVSGIVEADKKAPWRFILSLGGLWCVMITLLFLKGGSKQTSIVGIQCGSASFWLILAVTAIVLILFSACIGFFLRREYQRRLQARFPFHPNDLRYTYKNSILFPNLCALAGVAAGYLGIGGGMVKTPIMLELNMVPTVASATSSFMIIFTSSSTSLQFLILGKIAWGHAVLFFCCGLVGALIGQMGLAWAVKRLGRQSFVTLLLGCLIAISGLAMAIINVIEIADGSAIESWRSICAGE